MNPLYKKALKIAKDYFFHSKDKFYAWIYLIGSIATIIALVGLNSVFGWWLVNFFASLSAASSVLFLSCMQSFLFISLGWIILHALKEFFIENLKLNWRKSLFENLLPKYTRGEINYLDLHRHPELVDNPEQRIQEESSKFVEQSLDLSFEFFQSVLTLISFTASLWIIGGNISFTLFGLSLFIPGYMVWASILFSVVASLITHWIGKALAPLNQKEQTLEANMRKELFTLNKDAESIALLQGEDYHHRSILNTFNEICSTILQKIFIKLKLTAFSGVYDQLTVIFPYLMAAPALFAGMIGLDQVMQCAYTFSQVQSSLSWFIYSYAYLTEYRTSIERLSALIEALEPQEIDESSKAITVSRNETDEIQIKDLSLATPKDTSTHILSELNVTLPKHRNIVIEGENGLGKSTLFKVIAGTWRYGRGEIITPKRSDIYVIPQKPVMLKSSIKQLLSYPNPTATFTDEQYQTAITVIGLSQKTQDRLIQNLKENLIEDWSSLSGGEQQKIEIARCYLRKPPFILLDESTAAMDRDSEARIYELLRSSRSTFISIAHRDVSTHHHQVYTLSRDRDSSRGTVIQREIRTAGL